MKKIIFLAAAVSFVLSFSADASKYSRPDPSHKKDAVSDAKKEPFTGWDKLDLAAKDIWNEWKKHNNINESEDEKVEVMVRTTVPVKREQRKILTIIGFRSRSVIPYKNKGSIVTGQMPVRHMDELAAVDFVDYIEAAKKLSGKEGPKAIK